MAFLNSCNKATVKENSQRIPGTVVLPNIGSWPQAVASESLLRLGWSLSSMVRVPCLSSNLIILSFSPSMSPTLHGKRKTQHIQSNFAKGAKWWPMSKCALVNIANIIIYIFVGMLIITFHIFGGMLTITYPLETLLAKLDKRPRPWQKRARASATWINFVIWKFYEK